MMSTNEPSSWCRALGNYSQGVAVHPEQRMDRGDFSRPPLQEKNAWLHLNEIRTSHSWNASAR
jgi:hypothetical protein